MRHLQNVALFGLWGGTAILLWGMTSGSLMLALLGAALGLLIGVPAAYMVLQLDGKLFDLRKLADRRLARSLRQTTTPMLPRAQAAPIEIIPRKVETEAAMPPVLPPPQYEAAISIPVRVEHPEQALAEALRPAPAPPVLSQAERQHVIDEIESTNDVQEIADFAAHKDALVRLYAIQRLGNLGDERAADTLQAALQDDQDIVKRAARIALNKLNVPADHP